MLLRSQLMLAACLTVIAKKDPRDYTEADLERLLEEWDQQFETVTNGFQKDEEPLPEDELPEHLRPQPQLDLTKLDMSNPDNVLALSKKGKTLISFVTVSGNPTQAELEDITKLWQGSLYNAHINAERYVIDEKRAIFKYSDGSLAWQGKDFLIQQDRCEEVTIEGKSYPGKGAKQEKKTEL